MAALHFVVSAQSGTGVPTLIAHASMTLSQSVLPYLVTGVLVEVSTQLGRSLPLSSTLAGYNFFIPASDPYWMKMACSALVCSFLFLVPVGPPVALT
jgi:hypothetical protein